MTNSNVAGGADNCKDVDVVSVHPECSTSTAVDSSGSEMMSDRSLKDNALGNFRARNHEHPSLDYDSGHDAMSTVSSSIFEFQKAERGTQRLPLAPFSKPAPSKWDDAQKWIASPTWSRPKSGQGVGSRKAGNIGYGSRQPTTKVVVEVPDSKVANFEEPDTKRIDTNQTKMETGGQKFVNWEAEPYPIADSYIKPVLMIENSVGESASKNVLSLFLIFFFCLVQLRLLFHGYIIHYRIRFSALQSIYRYILYHVF